MVLENNIFKMVIIIKDSIKTINFMEKVLPYFYLGKYIWKSTANYNGQFK